MTLLGIIADKKDIKLIKRCIQKKYIELIEITNQSLPNIKNVRFDEIIIMKDIISNKIENKYLVELISNVKYLIINADIKMEVLKNIKLPTKIITFGFNPKSTITISSVNEKKIILDIQRKIEKINKQVIEKEEKEIQLQERNIYINIIVFIIKILNNIY